MDKLVCLVLLIHGLVVSTAYLTIQKIAVIDTVAELMEVLG